MAKSTPVDEFEDYKSKEAAEKAQKDLALWNSWHESGRKPEALQPLMKRYEPLLNNKVREWKAPQVNQAAFKAELQKIRTGRAHPGILDQVHVEYYGSHVPISQVANVTLLDARTISVQPWEKGMGAKIEKAIRESDLGLNPAAQGDLLRVPMPALTEERRKELTKVVRHAGEEAKIAVRSIRRDANDHLKKLLKDKQATEDEERRAQDEVQRLTDGTIGQIDKLVGAKEAEVLAV